MIVFMHRAWYVLISVTLTWLASAEARRAWAQHRKTAAEVEQRSKPFDPTSYRWS